MTNAIKKKYKVTQNKFHGDQIFYKGNNLSKAVKIGRLHLCYTQNPGCMCGGPEIERDDGAVYIDWETNAGVEKEHPPQWLEIEY